MEIRNLLKDGSLNIASPVEIIDTGKCAVCLTCVRVCPEGAMITDYDKPASNPLACTGCGTCRLGVSPGRHYHAQRERPGLYFPDQRGQGRNGGDRPGDAGLRLRQFGRPGPWPGPAGRAGRPRPEPASSRFPAPPKSIRPLSSRPFPRGLTESWPCPASTTPAIPSRATPGWVTGPITSRTCWSRPG